MGFVTSDVGQLLSFISVLIDLNQCPDEARPLVSLGHTDLLQKDKRTTHPAACQARDGESGT